MVFVRKEVEKQSIEAPSKGADNRTRHGVQQEIIRGRDFGDEDHGRVEDAEEHTEQAGPRRQAHEDRRGERPPLPLGVFGWKRQTTDADADDE